MRINHGFHGLYGCYSCGFSNFVANWHGFGSVKSAALAAKSILGNPFNPCNPWLNNNSQLNNKPSYHEKIF